MTVWILLRFSRIVCCLFSAIYLSAETLAAIPETPRIVNVTVVCDSIATALWQYNDNTNNDGYFYGDDSTNSDVRFKITLRYWDNALIRPIVVDLSGDKRTHIFHNLYPKLQYVLYIVAYNEYGSSNDSNAIIFTTGLVDAKLLSRLGGMYPGEIVLIVACLLIWLAVVFLFLHKWGKIRVLEPREPRYRHRPKNLESIKVITNPANSVIYRNYPNPMIQNMLARERKLLLRMRTMPNIKVQEAGVVGDNGDNGEPSCEFEEEGQISTPLLARLKEEEMTGGDVSLAAEMMAEIATGIIVEGSPKEMDGREIKEQEETSLEGSTFVKERR